MHDLNYFREHLDVFAEMAKKRGATLDLDAFRSLDKERRELITTTEQLKAQRNKANDEIATLKKSKQNADALITEMKQVSERIKQGDERITQLDATQREFLLTIPNVPHSSVPVGHGAEENVEVRRWVRRRSLILRRNRTGKSASVPRFLISRPRPKLRGRDLRSIRAGERGSNAPWRIFFSMYTRASTATPKSCRHFW